MRINTRWLTLILMLAVLAAPTMATADVYWFSSPGGSIDPGGGSGDPDDPGFGRNTPGYRSGPLGGTEAQRPRIVQTDRMWMGRYLMLLSGLRNFYLR